MWVDVSIFGKDHIYQTPTSRPVFLGNTPHDPEVSMQKGCYHTQLKLNFEELPLLEVLAPNPPVMDHVHTTALKQFNSIS